MIINNYFFTIYNEYKYNNKNLLIDFNNKC